MAIHPLTGVSYEIHQELDSPTIPSDSQIFAWLSFNAGKLNDHISTFYEYVESDYSPQLETDEKSILKALYFQTYYTNKARSALIGAEDNSVLSLKDDVSSVSFVNRKEVAKEYRNIATEYSNEACHLANLYKHNRSGPRDIASSPTGYHW